MAPRSPIQLPLKSSRLGEFVAESKWTRPRIHHFHVRRILRRRVRSGRSLAPTDAPFHVIGVRTHERKFAIYNYWTVHNRRCSPGSSISSRTIYCPIISVASFRIHSRLYTMPPFRLTSTGYRSRTVSSRVSLELFPNRRRPSSRLGMEAVGQQHCNRSRTTQGESTKDSS
jgi:hypothetical protein